MNFRHYALAVVLSLVATVALPASPSNTYCSTDSGVTWLPCGSGGGGGGSAVTPTPSSDSSAAITPVVSTAAESNHVLKAAAGNFYGATITNGAAAGYVMVFNATSAPADGAVTPLYCWAMPATTSTLGVGFDYPARFSTGITIVYSTTGCFTKTASATAMFSAQVK